MYTLPLANNKAARCRHDVSSVCTPLTESELVAATEALIVTGPPTFCAPVVTLSALSRNVPAELDASVETTYSVPEVGSITGVEVTPTYGKIASSMSAVSPLWSSETFHNGVPPPQVSASYAYTLSF